MTRSPHSTEDDEAQLPTCAEQLHDLAHSLPRYIEQTVLPKISEDVAAGAEELSAQVASSRQALLQSAVLRRSAVLAPLLKQRLIRNASHLQRRRAQLVEVLQRHTRGRQASASSRSNGRSTATHKESAAWELRLLWKALEAAMDGEEHFANIVQAPLCPSTETLTSFLAEAVTQKELHRRVLAQVEGGEPSQRIPAASGRGNSTASMNAPSSPSSPSDGTGEGADSIEDALHILLRHADVHRKHQSAAPAVRKGGRNSSASPRPASTSAAAVGDGGGGLTHGEGNTRVPVRGVSDGACDVDEDSEDDDDDEVQLLESTAEEDVSLYDPVVTPPLQQQQSSRSVPASPPGPWVRVPGIVSLRKFCADLPWVADLAEERYAETRGSNKAGGSGGGGGEGSYLSCGVQRGEKDARSRNAASRGQPPPPLRQQPASCVASLGPLGGFFSPALASGAAEGNDGQVTAAACRTAPTHSRAESQVARAMRHAAASGSPFSASDLGRTASFPAAPETEDTHLGSDAQADDRTVLARAVVRCLSPAVDDAWKDAEERVVAAFCSLSGPGGPALINAKRSLISKEEEESVSAFLEVMRVRYTVELAAQVVAARQAVELLLESEDGVVFDGARLLSLSLNTTEGNETEQLDGGGVRHRRGAAPCASSVLPCMVLTLPGLEEVFYVVAYCTGAAMLREAAVAMEPRGGTGATGGNRLENGGKPLVIDVEAQEEGPDASGVVDLVNEEDGTAQQQASLQIWAAGFEKRFLTPPSGCFDFAGDSVVHASPSFPHLFRLWLYLWKFVLAVPPLNAAEEHGRSPQSSEAPARHPQSGRNGGGAPTQLLVSLRTARRWMEKVVRTSVLHGCAESCVVYSAVVSASPQRCLPSCWAPSEAERVVRLTTAQARQALLRAADVNNTPE